MSWPARLLPEAPGAPQPAAVGADVVAVGYLRAFVTLLVLAHHAVLGYVPYIPPPRASLLAEPRLWQAFPVVDLARWGGFGLFTGFNDTFFMALMFFLSGLFVWPSLAKKGAAPFARGRALRLGLPFVAVAAVVAPLAYYAAFLQSGAAGGVAGFARQWLALGNWPAGPAWFLWVLLAFDLAAAVLFAGFPAWGERLARLAAGARRRPALFCGLLIAASAAGYFPLALTLGPSAWATWGPFAFQTSRILHYLVYFLAGIAVGAHGIERGLLAADGTLARRWPLWAGAALIAFGAAIVVTVLATAAPRAAQPAWGPVWAATFVLSSAASSFAFLALFVRFARRRARPLDSLRANAYGMYVLHYPFASWLPLALLGAHLSGFSKGALAALGTIALSWAAVAALRRIRVVAKVI